MMHDFTHSPTSSPTSSPTASSDFIPIIVVSVIIIGIIATCLGLRYISSQGYWARRPLRSGAVVEIEDELVIE